MALNRHKINKNDFLLPTGMNGYRYNTPIQAMPMFSLEFRFNEGGIV